MYDIKTEIEYKKALYTRQLLRIKNLPSIPAIMMEVSSLLNDPKTSASELGRIIAKDQAMVAKLLMIANSPLYGIPRKVSTVEFAIVILGFNHIKNIVVALSIMDAFQEKSRLFWNREKFWTHSLVIGVLSKRIAFDLGLTISSEAFTAGLLHDLGISAIQRFFPVEFNKICHLVETENIRYSVAEKLTIGLTHCEVGQFLINNWNLPQNLSNAVRFHHEPGQMDENNTLASIIHLADYMTQRYQQGDFNWDENMEFDSSIIQSLSFTDTYHLNAFVDSYKELIEEHINSIEL